MIMHGFTPDTRVETLPNSGASGLLGSAIRNAFNEDTDKFEVLSLAHSRKGPGLINIDLTNKEEVDKTFSKFKPDCMHALADCQ